MKIYLKKNENDHDEHPEDVTEVVKALYDLCLGSMDFRSGFWTAEDAAPVAMMARLAGFESAEEVEKYVSEALHYEEVRAWRRDNGVGGITGAQNFSGHGHVFSSQGRCMWPGCKKKGFE